MVAAWSALTTHELARVLSQAIPDATNDDKNGTDVDSPATTPSSGDPISREAEHDPGKEQGSSNETQPVAGRRVEVSLLCKWDATCKERRLTHVFH
jgi:hypothetical protein